jgi:hypothetical protein
MTANHKMLCPEGTDSWALNCPESNGAAACGLGRAVGEAISGGSDGRFWGDLRMVVRNCPYWQVIGNAWLTDGYG